MHLHFISRLASFAIGLLVAGASFGVSRNKFGVSVEFDHFKGAGKARVVSFSGTATFDRNDPEWVTFNLFIGTRQREHLDHFLGRYGRDEESNKAADVVARKLRRSLEQGARSFLEFRVFDPLFAETYLFTNSLLEHPHKWFRTTALPKAKELLFDPISIADPDSDLLNFQLDLFRNRNRYQIDVVLPSEYIRYGPRREWPRYPLDGVEFEMGTAQVVPLQCVVLDDAKTIGRDRFVITYLSTRGNSIYIPVRIHSHRGPNKVIAGFGRVLRPNAPLYVLDRRSLQTVTDSGFDLVVQRFEQMSLRRHITLNELFTNLEFENYGSSDGAAATAICPSLLIHN